MDQTEPSLGKTSLYRFVRPDGTEIEQLGLADDDAAEGHARALSKTQQIPVTIERHDHVDWEYVTEADERTG